MRKEPLIAIIIGSVIGIGVAFGLWRMSTNKNVNSENSPQENATLSQEVNTNFAIVSPADNSVSTNNSVNIAGFSPPGSIVVATGAAVSVGTVSDTGEFQVEASLSPGSNVVTIWSIENGVAQNEELSLIYSSEIDEQAGGTATAISGAVTDIAEDTLQIRSATGEIEQLSITDNTTYASLLDDTEEIEFSDIAIGDYVTALGQNGTSVMEVARVLLTTEDTEREYVLETGSISALSSSEFLVNTEGGEVSIDATGSVDIYDAALETTRLATAKEGSQIIIVGVYEDDELVADTIILL